MTEPREIEAKFEIDDPTPLRELKKAPPLTVVSAEEIIQVDTYLDTPDGALHQAGSTLRLRESSGRWTLTYKGCLLYTSPSLRDRTRSRMPSST